MRTTLRGEGQGYDFDIKNLPFRLNKGDNIDHSFLKENLTSGNYGDVDFLENNDYSLMITNIQLISDDGENEILYFFKLVDGSWDDVQLD